MATKKYIAKSHVSLSVKMTAEKNAHITFVPLTGGGSVYYTADEQVQNALEQHPKYGKLFKQDALYQERKAIVAKPKEEKKQKEINEVQVSCLDDAKDYLSDKFGISRTKLRSQEGIEKAAAANGVRFIGLE